MLKKNINEYKLNAFNEIGNKWPILIAGDAKNGYNGMTVSWGGIGVIWGKNVAYLFVRESRYTYEFIEKSDSVTLSFLSDDYKDAKALFGSKSGRDLNKFEATGLHPCLDVDMSCYYVAEAEYCFKMKKLYSVDLPYESLDQDILDRYYPNGDMHRMYVCEIKQYLVKEDN